jgi:hypothetical protein
MGRLQKCPYGLPGHAITDLTERMDVGQPNHVRMCGCVWGCVIVVTFHFSVFPAFTSTIKWYRAGGHIVPGGAAAASWWAREQGQGAGCLGPGAGPFSLRQVQVTAFLRSRGWWWHSTCIRTKTIRSFDLGGHGLTSRPGVLQNFWVEHRCVRRAGGHILGAAAINGWP